MSQHDDSNAGNFHAKPEIIAYFKENKLNHESADYREGPKEAAYRFWRAWYSLINKSGSLKEYLRYCKINNMHRTKPDSEAFNNG